MPVDDEFEGGRPDGFADGFTLALHGAAALAPDQALHSLATRAERIGRRRRNRRRAAWRAGWRCWPWPGASRRSAAARARSIPRTGRSAH
ncbi:hypothetical protein ACFQ0T_29510 [Kitasatospora gansuensis]